MGAAGLLRGPVPFLADGPSAPIPIPAGGEKSQPASLDLRGNKPRRPENRSTARHWVHFAMRKPISAADARRFRARSFAGHYHLLRLEAEPERRVQPAAAVRIIEDIKSRLGE